MRLAAILSTCGLALAGAARGQVQATFDSPAFLLMPARGRFEVENHTSWFSASWSVVAASRDRVRAAMAEAQLENAGWFPRDTHDPDWTPVALKRMRTKPQSFTALHRVVVHDARLTRCSWTYTLPGAPHDRTAQQALVRDGDEILLIDSSRRVPADVIRRKRVPNDDGVLGSMLDLTRAYRQYDFLAGYAHEQGELRRAESASGTCTTFELNGASLRECPELDAFAPIGFYEILARVTGRLTAAGETARLELEWFDLTGGVFDRTTVDWRADRGMPASWVHETFLPGTPELLYRSEDRCVRTDGPEVARAEVVWTPRRGERVEDWRHGSPVTYTIDEDGVVPREASVITRAGVRAEELGPSQVVVTSASSDRASPEAADPSPLVCAVPEVDLGPQPLSSRHRVSFVVENTSDDWIQLGRVEADCGCLDPRLAASAIAPRGRTTLQVTQQVQAVGRARHRIAVPTASGDALAVELFVRLTGVAQLVVLPEAIELGRVSEGDPLRFPVSVPRQPMTEYSEPVPTVAGARVGVRWRRDAATGELHGWVEFAELRTRLFGAQERVVDFRAGAGSDGLARVRALLELVPRELESLWPDCTLSIGDAEVTSHTWAFPELFEPAELPGAEQLASLGIELAISAPASAGAHAGVLLVAQPASRAPGIVTTRVVTRAGEIGLRLVFVP